MRTIIQRVGQASVSIDGSVVGQINAGIVLLVGFGHLDSEEDLDYSIRKIVNLRIFSDESGKMNLSLLDVGGEILVISQFTLYADTKKGNRPSFIQSAKPQVAIPLYERFIEMLNKEIPTKIQTGQFGANMQVNLTNDGPVTISLDSKNES